MTMTASVPEVLGAHPAKTASSIRFVDEVLDLAQIFEPAVNAVVLRRSLSRSLHDDALDAVGEGGFRRQFAAPSQSLTEAVSQELRGFRHLSADVRFLAELLAELTDASQIGVRLARLETAMCPRFHVDRVTVRVVVTYEGPGTELVSSHLVDRTRLGHAAQGADDEVSGLLFDASKIQRANASDVVLLKGEAWPDNEGRGAVHRSPAVCATQPRLVLTLDPL